VSIRVRCPKCSQTAELPEEAIGKTGVCNTCGASVIVPARMTKVCIDCGADVTFARHARDADNNCVCAACWKQRNSVGAMAAAGAARAGADGAAQGAPAAGPSVDAPPGEPTGPGRKGPVWESLADMAEREFPTPARAPVAAPAGPASFTGPLAVVLAAAALLVALWAAGRGGSTDQLATLRLQLEILQGQADVLADLGQMQLAATRYQEVLSRIGDSPDPVLGELARRARAGLDRAISQAVDPWEEENRAQVLVLKSQADIFLSLGKYREAADAYQKLLSLTAGKPLSPPLADIVRQARSAQQLAAAEQRRLEPPSAPAPANPPDGSGGRGGGTRGGQPPAPVTPPGGRSGTGRGTPGAPPARGGAGGAGGSGGSGGRGSN
jgi:hypothetical protein